MTTRNVIVIHISIVLLTMKKLKWKGTNALFKSVICSMPLLDGNSELAHSLVSSKEIPLTLASP